MCTIPTIILVGLIAILAGAFVLVAIERMELSNE